MWIIYRVPKAFYIQTSLGMVHDPTEEVLLLRKPITETCVPFVAKYNSTSLVGQQ